MSDASQAAQAGGSLLSIYGKLRANAQQAEAELQNALWLEEQADFALEASEREADIYARNANMVIGEQIGGFAANNVEMSGSAMDTINESYALMSAELDAIERQGQMQAREAFLKAHNSRNTAAYLTSPTTQGLVIASGIADMGSKMAAGGAG